MVELKVLSLSGQMVQFLVSSQTLKENDFVSIIKDKDKIVHRSFGTDGYKSSTGWELRSTIFPMVDKEEKVLYLRGRDYSKDEKKMEVSLSDYMDILKAIKEYNQEESK